MLTPTGAVKVMDFGIARALADSSATMTQTQAVIGTAQYLSPEQAKGQQVDARSDLYSTGCLLFELLTGRPPFVGDSPVSVAYQHVGEMPAAAEQPRRRHPAGRRRDRHARPGQGPRGALPGRREHAGRLRGRPGRPADQRRGARARSACRPARCRGSAPRPPRPLPLATEAYAVRRRGHPGHADCRPTEASRPGWVRRDPCPATAPGWACRPATCTDDGAAASRTARRPTCCSASPPSRPSCCCWSSGRSCSAARRRAQGRPCRR